MDRGQTIFGVTFVLGMAVILCTLIVKLVEYNVQSEMVRQKVAEEVQKTEQEAIRAGLVKGSFTGWVKPVVAEPIN